MSHGLSPFKLLKGGYVGECYRVIEGDTGSSDYSSYVGIGFSVRGSGLRVWGLGFKVWGYIGPKRAYVGISCILRAQTDSHKTALPPQRNSYMTLAIGGYMTWASDPDYTGWGLLVLFTRLKVRLRAHYGHATTPRQSYTVNSLPLTCLAQSHYHGREFLRFWDLIFFLTYSALRNQRL